MHSADVTEWWRSLPSGLEHGVTLDRRPPGRGPLMVDVAVRGLRAEGRGSIRLVESSGRTAGWYQALAVWDAAGRRIPARMWAQADAIRIEVDDEDARYPLVIDPLVATELAMLVSDDGSVNDNFGFSVALSADARWALVGVPDDDFEMPPTIVADAGSVQLFEDVSGTWLHRATFFATAPTAGARFGYSVAMSADGRTFLVGEPSHESTGRTWVFRRPDSIWMNAALEPSMLETGAQFGFAVAISADASRAVVGAPGNDTSAGSARVFRRSGVSWVEEAVLVAHDAQPGDRFGWSVAMSGDGTRVVVGVRWDDTARGVDAGSARVFVRTDTTWTEEAALFADDGEANDELGWAVALSHDGSRALVGARWDDLPGALNAGSARVFVRMDTTWTEEATLTASDVEVDAWFGWSVALSGDGSRALVGTVVDDVDGLTDAGSATLFLRDGSRWSEAGTLTASDAAAGDRFGRSIALNADGTRALVGAPLDDTPGGINHGSARLVRLALTEGEPCRDRGDCSRTFCVDGVCCESACGGGEPTDCQACSEASGGMTDGRCTLARAGTSCRAAVGPCDAAETCSGTSPDCPNDLFASAGTMCRDAAGPCDVAESCSGMDADCPPDAVLPSSQICRDASCSGGTATSLARCTGTSAECPGPTTVSCAPYVCGSDACLMTCATDADCVGGHTCRDGRCVSLVVDAGTTSGPDAASTDAGAALDGGFDAATMGGRDAGLVPREPTSCFCTAPGAGATTTRWRVVGALGLVLLGMSALLRRRAFANVRRRAVVLALVAWSGWGTAGTACAQQDVSNEPGRAEYERGAELYRQGRFAEAVGEFERAYELSRRPAFLFNIFVSRRDSGDVAGAADALRRYLADETTLSAEDRASLRERLRAMEQFLAAQRVASESAAAEPSPSSDDAESSAEQGASIGDAADTPGDATVASSGTSDLATVGYVLMGGAAVAVASAIAFGVLALDASAELDRACGVVMADGRRYCPADLDQRPIVQRFEAFRAASWVSAGVAVVAAGVGLALALLGTSGSEGSPDGASRPVVALWHDGGYLGWQGRF